MIYLKKILFINFLFTFLFAETGAKFLLISPGSKASSLANAQVANSMDAFASYWNPASLTNIKKTQFGFVHFKLFPNLSNDMYFNFIGFNHQFKKYGNIGGHLIHLNLGKQFHMGNDKNEVLGEFYCYMNAFVLSYAYPYSKKISMGINLRWLHQQLFNIQLDELNKNANSNNFNIDIAMLCKKLYKDINFGITIKNLGSDIQYSISSEKQKQPLLVTMGIFSPLFDKNNISSFIYYDLQYLQPENSINHCLGIENKLFNQFLLRTGYYSSNDNNYITWGSGYKINEFNFDFSMILGNSHNVLNNTMQFSILYEI